MKKQFIPTPKVQDFVENLDEISQNEYLKIVNKLEENGYLVEPYGKKLTKNLFEIRIRSRKQVRVIYIYSTGDFVIGVHAFVKKTQKTPRSEIKQAERVIKALNL